MAKWIALMIALPALLAAAPTADAAVVFVCAAGNCFVAAAGVAGSSVGAAACAPALGCAGAGHALPVAPPGVPSVGCNVVTHPAGFVLVCV